jgi:hypothetical protein
MARGHKIDCGCGLFFQRQVGVAAVMEDAVFLIWAAGLYVWERRTTGCAHPTLFSRKAKTED